MNTERLNTIFTEFINYEAIWESSPYTNLDLLLQGVPIFEDFDSEKDKKYLGEKDWFLACELTTWHLYYT